MTTTESIDKLKLLIGDVIKDVPIIIESMNEIKEWDSLGEILNNIRTITDFVEEIGIIGKVVREDVIGIELTDSELNSAIASFINEKVNIPWLPEAIEQKIFEIGIGMVMTQIDKMWDTIQIKFKTTIDKTKSIIVSEDSSSE
jgi:hypothetical protein